MGQVMGLSLKPELRQDLTSKNISDFFSFSEEEYIQIINGIRKFAPKRINEGYIPAGYFNTTFGLNKNSSDTGHTESFLSRKGTVFEKLIKPEVINIFYNIDNVHFESDFGVKFNRALSETEKLLIQDLKSAPNNEVKETSNTRIKVFNSMKKKLTDNIKFKKNIISELLTSQHNFLMQVHTQKKVDLSALLKLNLQTKKDVGSTFTKNSNYVSSLTKQLELKLDGISIDVNLLAHRNQVHVIREGLIKSIMSQKEQIINILLKNHSTKLDKPTIELFKKIKDGKANWNPETMKTALELIHPKNLDKFGLKVDVKTLKKKHPNLFIEKRRL